MQQFTQLPTLYKTTSTGAIQEWTISTRENKIITTFGQIGSDKMQQTVDVIKAGKNLGKANETDAVIQASLEATAKHEKMLKKGYVTSLERAKAEENDLQGVQPMLAHKYSEHAEKIIYPAACQPKLDGIRTLTRSDGTLWSRTHKPVISIPHIQAEIKFIFPDIAPNFDGEAYNHAFKDNFEHIVHLVNQKKTPDPQHTDVEYHIYDIADSLATFKERMTSLQALSNLLNSGVVNNGSKIHLKIVPTFIVNSHEELMAKFEEFRALGYEGAMVRNLDSKYEGKRSYNLQKVKEFDSSEFKIIGIKEGRGKLQGCVGSFTCVTEDGIEFEAKMEGAHERLKAYFENHALWENQMLEVKFQGFTTKNKVPRFPVGLRLRVVGL